MDKDARYRAAHPERCRAASKASYEKNREAAIEKKRQFYQDNKEAILLARKEDKQMCPICQIEYGRLYLDKHLKNRHKILPENLVCVKASGPAPVSV